MWAEWDFPLLAHKAIRSLRSPTQSHSTSLHSTQIAHCLLQKEKKAVFVFIRWTVPTLPPLPPVPARRSLLTQRQKVHRMTGSGMEGGCAPFICMYCRNTETGSVMLQTHGVRGTGAGLEWEIRRPSNFIKTDLLCTPSKILVLAHALLTCSAPYISECQASSANAAPHL